MGSMPCCSKNVPSRDADLNLPQAPGQDGYDTASGHVGPVVRQMPSPRDNRTDAHGRTADEAEALRETCGQYMLNSKSELGTLKEAPPNVDQEAEVKCRSCGNTGIDFMGKACSCEIGQQKKLNASPEAKPDAQPDANPVVEAWPRACKAGDVVQAIWPEDRSMRDATVTLVESDGQTWVRWDEDGSQSRLPMRSIYRDGIQCIEGPIVTPEIGDTVQAIWPGDGRKHFAVVKSLESDGVWVKWEDEEGRTRVPVESIWKDGIQCAQEVRGVKDVEIPSSRRAEVTTTAAHGAAEAETSATDPTPTAAPFVSNETPAAPPAVGNETPAAAPAVNLPSSDNQPSKPAEICKSCGHRVSMEEQPLSKDDPLLRHYKKGGMWGAVAGAFGDKKTMWCHQITSDGKFAAREFSKVQSEEEAWKLLGKRCMGRYAYNSSAKCLECGPLVPKDHDRTCNEETCIFVKSGLKCPAPEWALK